ncbi:uncharacterized protein EI90DRAFT_3068967 [Cantharellus anzutake]|uniref:uncharacterized protein n=1 Tax=Cantharellus anzutake TaxID=1750568 RepID=UPI0019042E2A|nr:uncharacterized protein EI90DRAFT_3068940 [Cantharellus anzutake]XP_038913301.1 uncharacterized protein EI90DRAFT_3068967 [Cantharellus anzutake]KAF8327033.1 hypothetical protein EI90DRAFT_3068940 [Cantharellus anzutake]KAF8327037.1 hypothetical protein EI90DRAFT_3068967 [Cantharellus anzutake]
MHFVRRNTIVSIVAMKCLHRPRANMLNGLVVKITWLRVTRASRLPVYPRISLFLSLSLIFLHACWLSRQFTSHCFSHFIFVSISIAGLLFPMAPHTVTVVNRLSSKSQIYRTSFRLHTCAF